MWSNWPAGRMKSSAWPPWWATPKSSGGKSDLAYHALAIVVGTLVGISVNVGGIPVTLGVGGGVLVSGLCFGWLQRAYPVFGAMPQAANGFFPSSA